LFRTNVSKKKQRKKEEKSYACVNGVIVINWSGKCIRKIETCQANEIKINKNVGNIVQPFCIVFQVKKARDISNFLEYQTKLRLIYFKEYNLKSLSEVKKGACSSLEQYIFCQQGFDSTSVKQFLHPSSGNFNLTFEDVSLKERTVGQIMKK